MDKTLHFVVGVFGNVFALFLYLAPLFTFIRIVKKRSTEQFSGIPYLVTMLNCMISAWYGLPIVSQHNLLVTTICTTGAAIEVVYVAIFLMFASRRERAKMFGLLALVLGLFSVYVLVSLFVFRENGRTLFCGVVTTIIATAMYASPMVIIKLVIKTKSVEFMPFHVSLAVCLCSTCWTFFGLLEKDPFIIIPSALGCGCGAMQLILYAMYGNNEGQIEKSTIVDQFEEIEKINGIKFNEEKPSNGRMHAQEEQV